MDMPWDSFESKGAAVVQARECDFSSLDWDKLFEHWVPVSRSKSAKKCQRQGWGLLQA